MHRAECWQHEVKQKMRRRSGVYPTRVSPVEGAVSRIDFAAAKEFITKYEWLGTIGAAKYCFGLTIRGQLAAVACYTAPSSPVAYSRVLGPGLSRSVYQLCRGASAHWAPKWAASMTISRSLRILERHFAAKIVIAFADPEAGEIGAVYQAANALYLGLSDSRGPGKYIIGGVEYHARAVQKHFGCAAHDYLKEIDPEYQRIQRTKKHRYAFVLGRGAARKYILDRLKPLVRPYPKRLAVRLQVA